MARRACRYEEQAIHPRMNALSLSILQGIDTLHLRLVSSRIRPLRRSTAFGSTRMPTPERVKSNPKPGSVASRACQTEDFARFTLSFNRPRPRP